MVPSLLSRRSRVQDTASPPRRSSSPGKFQKSPAAHTATLEDAPPDALDSLRTDVWQEADHAADHYMVRLLRKASWMRRRTNDGLRRHAEKTAENVLRTSTTRFMMPWKDVS